MSLKLIFQSATLVAMHTGIATGIATAIGSENPVAVGLTSCAVGITSLLGGAFAGHSITYKPSPDQHYTEYDGGGARPYGLIGYATGSVIGFALKHYSLLY